MKRLAGLVLAAALLTLPAQALEREVVPIAASGYTYYAIDADGKFYAWGDTLHGAVGPADQDPLPWENANILLEDACSVAGGFSMSAAIDTDGVLWGWGGHAGRTFGEGEPFRLLEDVVEISIGDTRCAALRSDGTVWVWGARSGQSLEAHPDDPTFPPTQILDHAVHLAGDMAVLEDGTLVGFQFDGDTVTTEPLMEHVADVCTGSGFYEGEFLLVQGQDGSLWRVPQVTVSEGSFGLGQPEKILEQVTWFAPGLAVTADGTLWAWGQNRPAMLREGQVDASDPLLSASSLETEPCDEIVKITEGIAAAVSGADRTLAVLEDGSLWQLPVASLLSDGKEPADQAPNQPEKLLARALLPDTPPAWPEEAPDPTVVASASLSAGEDAQSGGVPTETPEEEGAAAHTAPDNASSGVWLPAAAAVALAVIAWLRGRKH